MYKNIFFIYYIFIYIYKYIYYIFLRNLETKLEAMINCVKYSEMFIVNDQFQMN